MTISVAAGAGEQAFRVDGRSAIVTGGSGGGIGSAICRTLAAAGARIACLDLEPASAQAVVGELEQPGGISVTQPAARGFQASARLAAEMLGGAPVPCMRSADSAAT